MLDACPLLVHQVRRTENRKNREGLQCRWAATPEPAGARRPWLHAAWLSVGHGHEAFSGEQANRGGHT